MLAVITVGATPDDPAILALGAEGEPMHMHGPAPLADLVPLLRGATSVGVVLPGTEAATRRLSLPVQGERALAAAAALAFEDFLAEPVDGFHFAFGALEADGSRLVSALPTRVVSEWTEGLAARGIDADILTVDHLALVAPPTGIVVEGAGAALLLVRAGGLSGDVGFVAALTSALADGQMPTRVVMDDGDAPAALTARHHAALLTPAGVPSFRRGAFAKRRDWVGMIRSWRVAGALMAACLGLWLGNITIEGLRFGGAARTLMKDATTTFTAAFPDVAVRDLRRQAAGRASAGGAGSSFLGLSADLTAAIEESTAVQLTGLSYTDEGELVADLRFPDAAAIERLIGILNGRGVATREEGNLRLEDNGEYAGRLFLGGGGA